MRRATSAQPASVERSSAIDAIDDGDQIDHRPVLRVHEPVDPRVGKRRAQRRRRRHGMDDVAERAEPDDQEFIANSSALIRGCAPSRSRVE